MITPYLMSLVNNINKFHVERILVLLLILNLFFPIRYVFPSNFSNILGLYSDFTSFSLYLSDFLILGLILLNFRNFPTWFKDNRLIAALVIWLTLILVLQPASALGYDAYVLGRFILIALLYLIIANRAELLQEKALALLFSALGTLQSVIALFQFLNQKSIGLHFIGESPLGLAVIGASKAVSRGTEFVRGYGTFTHPNVLSAALLVGILFSAYLLFTSNTTRQKVVYSLLLALNIFGLTSSLSRAGIGATIVSIALFFAGLIFWHKVNRRIVWLCAVVVIVFVSAFASFQQFLFDRATVEDQAVTQRVVYNDIAVKMIQAYPIQGIGLGTSILSMQKHSEIYLEPWEIQPIHNYYLLSAAEMGIISAILLIIFFLLHVKQLVLRLKKSFDVFALTLLSIITGFLLLMLFDHYFYTLVQAQLLLWITLGIIAASTKRYFSANI